MYALGSLRRYLAMFCVALCLALSAQMSVAMLDRLQHLFDIEHAPTMLAGEIDHDDDHHLSGGHRHEHGSAAHEHENERAVHGYDQPVSHQHQGDGMLAPWLASTAFVFAGLRVAQTAYPTDRSGRPDVADRRRERPPKPVLERVA